ncbi:MAG: phosphatase PAP2 family protein [Rhodobacteraceae bacterium]|nr:phosphatase PAP2 family protein [Paracoccaceae bacterium]
MLIGLLSAFGAVCIAVATGATGAFDAAILLALREPGDVAQPIGPPWMLETMRDFTALGSTGVLTLLTVGAALYLLVSGRRRTAGLVLVAMVGGLVLNNLLKLGVARPRPDLVPHAVAVFTKSFPSGHAMNSAVVYLTLGTLLARTQRALGPRSLVMTLAVGLPVLIGVSRIYLGVHWPSDVLAGWTLGAGWALAVWLVMSRGQGAQ